MFINKNKNLFSLYVMGKIDYNVTYMNEGIMLLCVSKLRLTKKK